LELSLPDQLTIPVCTLTPTADPPPPPALFRFQLEALLVALHHTHHFCVFGSELPAAATAATAAGYGYGAASPPPPPRRAAQAELTAAQGAMFQQLPSVIYIYLCVYIYI